MWSGTAHLMSLKRGFLHLGAIEKMTKKNDSQQKQKPFNKAKWVGFVNVRLQTSEKEAIKENLMGEEAGYEFLMNAATAGFKCSISYSIPEDVYTVSLTGQYQEKPNAGITMSMRHRELIVALTALQHCATQDGLLYDWSERFSVMNDDDW